jgi:hypothetical protein
VSPIDFAAHFGASSGTFEPMQETPQAEDPWPATARKPESRAA